MKKLVIIEEPVFKSSINFFIGYSFEELNKYLEKLDWTEQIEEKYKGVLGLSWCQQDNNGVYFHSIWIQSMEWTLSNQSVIGHEICHAIFDIMSTKGLNIYKDDQNEHFCYLWEYYFYIISQEIAKIDKSKKNKKKN